MDSVPRSGETLLRPNVKLMRRNINTVLVTAQGKLSCFWARLESSSCKVWSACHPWILYSVDRVDNNGTDRLQQMKTKNWVTGDIGKKKKILKNERVNAFTVWQTRLAKNECRLPRIQENRHMEWELLSRSNQRMKDKGTIFAHRGNSWNEGLYGGKKGGWGVFFTSLKLKWMRFNFKPSKWIKPLSAHEVNKSWTYLWRYLL